MIAAGYDEQDHGFQLRRSKSRIESAAVLDHSLDKLTSPPRDTPHTLQTGESQNSELMLRQGDDGLVVRASTSIFHGEVGQVLGALMVLTDVTALKRLELQIRRSDRLASLGTLSAGMAHEIKNPLVSIKTFAQLLPERYQDSDFRQTFSNLIGHEIDRIDSLVNQLLRFARPAKTTPSNARPEVWTSRLPCGMFIPERHQINSFGGRMLIQFARMRIARTGVINSFSASTHAKGGELGPHPTSTDEQWVRLTNRTARRGSPR